MSEFICKRCWKVENKRGAYCSCFQFCRQCHEANTSICQIPTCARAGCNKPACKNPKGGFFSHCGRTCRDAPQRTKCAREGCKELACKNPNGGFYSHCGRTCRDASRCKFPGCGSNPDCKKYASFTSFSH